MPSAKIYQFPRAARRRLVPHRPPAPARYASRAYSPPRSGGFGLLLLATLVLAFLYLSGAVSVARHDALYAGLLAAVWGFYFAHESLLKTRVLGPILARVGRVLLAAAVVSFFGFIYWLVLTHS